MIGGAGAAKLPRLPLAEAVMFVSRFVRLAVVACCFAGGAYPPNTLLMIDRLVKEEFLIEVSAVAAL